MDNRKVTAPLLNVRNAASIEGEIIGELCKNDIVVVLETSGQWLRVQKDDLLVWAFSKYLLPLDSPRPTPLVTYKIVSDLDGKLKRTAKISCNFWNKFLVPRMPVVMRLGIFTDSSATIACSYKPYFKSGITYGVIEFNTKYLGDFSDEEIVGTIIHELGHTLGIGWDDWMNLFNLATGVFRPEYISAVPDLNMMRAETHYGPGTVFSHWDEESPYKKEIMTGFKDSAEFVLPVTIDVMKLLGHQIRQHLPEKVPLADLVDELKDIQFQMSNDAKTLDTDYFVQTEAWEHIYTEQRIPIDES